MRAVRPVGVGLLLLGLLLPVLPLLVWAVAGRWPYPDLVPQQLTGRGLRLLGDPASDVLTGLLTSAGIALAVTLAALAVGVPAGRALGRYRFRGRALVRLVLLAPAVVPPLTVLLGTQVVFLHYGLADTVPGVVLVQLVPTVPYVSLVAAFGFAGLDERYEAQARVLGAGPLRTTVLVTLPMLRPTLAAAAFFAFLISWSEYVLTLLVGGGVVRTLPLLLFAYARGSDPTQAAAVALLLVLPPLLLVGLLGRELAGAGRAALPVGPGRS